MQESENRRKPGAAIGGWAGWLLRGLKSTGRREPKLQLLERITLAPRQSLALVEADGRRLLVATSADGGPAFYALDRRKAPGPPRAESARSARVSW